MRTTLRSAAVMTLVAAGLVGLAAGQAEAGNYGPPRYGPPQGYGAPRGYGPPVHTVQPQYQSVVTYQPRVESYHVHETRFDHCNRPYQVEVLRQRTVQVQVVRQVRVYR